MIYLFIYIQRFGLAPVEIVELLKMSKAIKMLNPLKGIFIPDSPMPVVPDIGYCPYPKKMKCDMSSEEQWIRSIDGTCNNLNHHIIGRAMTPFRRLLPAKYSDGMVINIKLIIPKKILCTS